MWGWAYESVNEVCTGVTGCGDVCVGMEWWVFGGVGGWVSEFWTSGIVCMLILTISMSMVCTACLTQFGQKVGCVSFGKTLFNCIMQAGWCYYVLFDGLYALQSVRFQVGSDVITNFTRRCIETFTKNHCHALAQKKCTDTRITTARSLWRHSQLEIAQTVSRGMIWSGKKQAMVLPFYEVRLLTLNAVNIFRTQSVENSVLLILFSWLISTQGLWYTILSKSTRLARICHLNHISMPFK